jgi:predicted tellurium resistance membrane protein TerC
MTKQHVVTSVGEAPESERRRRMIIYTISMSVRFLCVALVVFTSGLWQWLFAIGAIFLPYFAVIVANNVGGEVKDTERAQTVEPLAIDLRDHLKEKS